MGKFKSRLKKEILTYDSLRDFVNNSPTAFGMLADSIELIAADTYAHTTEPGWCCACEADIAFAESWLRRTKPEIFKDRSNED